MRNTRKLGSAAAVGLCLTIPALPASAQVVRPQLVSRTAGVPAAELSGLVNDRNGRPLAGAVVSAVGSESAFAVSDAEGRFTLRTLPSGPYLVRAHLQGYLPARPRLMQIGTSLRGGFTITMVKRSDGLSKPSHLRVMMKSWRGRSGAYSLILSRQSRNSDGQTIAMPSRSMRA